MMCVSILGSLSMEWVNIKTMKKLGADAEKGGKHEGTGQPETTEQPEQTKYTNQTENIENVSR